MIGIGITSFKRPDYLSECLRNIRINSRSPYKVYVAFDNEVQRKGIAKKKNECLHHLQGCEYIFLFDDDCHPALPDWHDFFIQGHKVTDSHLLLYNDDEIHHVNSMAFYEKQTSIVSHKDSGGVFMFLSNKCVQMVGGFYDKYQVYGFEHIGYSTRVNKAGLTPFLYPTLEGTNNWLYAYDYRNKNIQSTLTNDQKLYYKKINKDILPVDYSIIYRPLTYL